MDFVCLSFEFLNGFYAGWNRNFYFAEAARLLLQNSLFVITVIWFSENWSCQVGEMVVYQIIRAKLMFNFLTWISLSNRHKHVIKGLFIHTQGSVTAWVCFLSCCTENTSTIGEKEHFRGWRDDRWCAPLTFWRDAQIFNISLNCFNQKLNWSTWIVWRPGSVSVSRNESIFMHSDLRAHKDYVWNTLNSSD